MHYHTNETTMFYWNCTIVILTLIILTGFEIMNLILTSKLADHGKPNDSLIFEGYEEMFGEN